VETIAFYSFKGGTGRSLAVAQLSVLLARFGQRVIVLDLDFGAPGLPFKYKSIFEWLEIPRLGVLELLNSYRQTKQIPNLETKLIPAIPEFLDVFPAGNPFTSDSEYWNTYTDPEMQTFLTTKIECDEFFEKLKDTISSTYPTADFLLIDTPSGVSRLAAIAAQLLADKFVCLSANHPDGLLGTNLILKDLQDKERQGVRVPSEWYSVLSRIPDYHFEEGKLKQTSEERLRSSGTEKNCTSLHIAFGI
jgi:cellulose biosynthesis protein BcsQ